MTEAAAAAPTSRRGCPRPSYARIGARVQEGPANQLPLVTFVRISRGSLAFAFRPAPVTLANQDAPCRTARAAPEVGAVSVTA